MFGICASGGMCKRSILAPSSRWCWNFDPRPDKLPPLLKGFKAVPPLVTDINLSLDDRFLYVSCWGTGEFQQYDVSDPFHPKLTGTVHLGGIVRHAAHPRAPQTPLNGGPQMVEVSRDGKRVYFTNSLYAPWDEQFYPEGLRNWMVKVDAKPGGGISLDHKFFLEVDGLRSHQVALEGRDASSSSVGCPEGRWSRGLGHAVFAWRVPRRQS